jgi:hypothetical protein
VLVGVGSNNNRQTRAAYSIDNSKLMAGLRVKLTYTFTSTGLMAPVFISVSGLLEEELRTATCPSGMLVVEIDGLTVAGGGVTVGAKLIGHVLFIRNDNDRDKDKKRVRYYRDHVLLPFAQISAEFFQR